jgi:phosphotransferase system enzyme I (PtsI)
MLILEDNVVLQQVVEQVRATRLNVETVFFNIMDGLRKNLVSGENEFYRDRAMDILDVKRRVLRNLLSRKRRYLEDLQEPAIIVSRYLNPSDMIIFDEEKVLGFVTETGGSTSHVAILARALQIPTLVGVENITFQVRSNQEAILDGHHGTFIIEPDYETVDHFRFLRRKYHSFEKKLFYLKDKPAVTKDGYHITISANVGLLMELNSVKEAGAHGIGLYRSEYLYLIKDELPDEEDQYKEYKELVISTLPAAVTIRTFDLGGDKLYSFFH